ncbi:MFS transporter [Streptomyces sp. SL13]|uniref:MFS transporter n=1 Tax=Streptantibioticus silvisoli TaxID=2705255 RepID=A0AA90GZ22_9ACTN|nr:MFS transporter [Streptantibioticus silvisoli]MDI5969126.1 MFS transporter [Streptantibioticus silvisoli]
MTSEATPRLALEDDTRPAAPSATALIVVLVGTFITVLDYFIANVAIPSIQSDLHAGSTQGQMVIIGYGVAFTAGLITGGRVGDLYGRRRMFVLGMVFFALSSAACGLAPDAGALIAGRVVQGVAAALMVPQVLGIIGTVYQGAHRARAFTLYGLVIGMAGVFGQLIGGALITWNVAGASWRAIFLINIPLCVVALALVRRSVPESKAAAGSRLDMIGAALVTAALALLVFALVEGRAQGWPAWSWACLAAAAVLTAAAVRHVRRTAAAGRGPLVAPALFRSRPFSLGLAATGAYFLAMGSFFFVLALYLQFGRGMSALGSGTVFLAVGGGYFAASVFSSRFTDVVAGRIAAGPVTLAAGYVLLGLAIAHVGTGGQVLWLVLPLVVAGLGMGLTTGPLTNLVLASADPEHAASASGLLNTAQEGCAAIGVAIAGTFFFPALGHHGDYAHALDVTLAPLVVFCAVAAVLVLLTRSRAKV